jgi:hypothetical protein
MSEPDWRSDAWAEIVAGMHRLPTSKPVPTADVVQVVRDGRDGADAMELLRWLSQVGALDIWEQEVDVLRVETFDESSPVVPAHLVDIARRLIEETDL